MDSPSPTHAISRLKTRNSPKFTFIPADHDVSAHSSLGRDCNAGEGFRLVMVLAASLVRAVEAEAQISRRPRERFAGAARPEW